ncbi:hypothetical protein [Gangjinia marincola]|uniref:hypothetical protein n=1 Tax=Gangjinia marincola TaxID=578463 RepID=UPI0031D94D9D
MRTLLLRLALLTGVLSLASFSGLEFYGVAILQVVSLVLVNLLFIVLCIHLFMQLTLVRDSQDIIIQRNPNHFPRRD